MAKSKYKAKILEELRILNAKKEMLCRILKEVQDEKSEDEVEEEEQE